MIENLVEYEAAQEELRYMEDFLARVRSDASHPNVGLTMAGIRKMIARLNEELGEYEALRLHRDLKQKRQSEWSEFIVSTGGAWQGDLIRPPHGDYEQREELPCELAE